MKHFNILILMLIFTIPIFGQRGYYRTDSIVYSGVKIINMGISNSYFCSVEKGDIVIKHTPYEVNEYGIQNGQAFKAFDIVIDSLEERFFLEILVKGDVSLYYLKLKNGVRKYYLSNGDGTNLTELSLTKPEVQDMISMFVGNCSHAAQNLKYLKPKKYSLVRYLNGLNSCSDYPYPRFRYGMRIGFVATQFYPVNESSTYAILDYNSDLSFSIGSFIDIPILASNLSFTTEIYIKRNHFSKSLNNSNESLDLIMNFSSLNIPLLLKYRFLRDGNIPYIQFGPSYSRTLKNNTTLYQYNFIENDVFIDINDSPIIQKNMGGFSIGSGIISDRGERCNWYVEMRYNHFYNLNPSQKHFNIGDISFITGFLF